MKSVQGSFFTGSVTVVVKGEHPELFFQLCMDELGIVVWDIEKKTDDLCKGNMRLRDIKRLRALRRGTSYKIMFEDKRGYPFIWRRWLKRKHIVLATILSFLLIYALSNIIWSIQINGVSSDIEKKIIQTLEDEDIKKGSWMFSIGSSSDIQHTITQEIPELLWVGVEKKGTSFLLEGVEKKQVDKIEHHEPRNLIASKHGVITYMHVSKGQPVVGVNDTVKKGDPLVLGTVERADEEDEEKTVVAAEGEVIAETWYEVDVSIPLQQQTEKVTGNHTHKWSLDLSFAEIPIWGWKEPDYDDQFLEEDVQPLYFLQWKTPFSIKKKTTHEQNIDDKELTKEEAIDIGLKQVQKDLKLKLGPDIVIKDDNVLHETVENGKVNVQMLIIVEEDIVETEPLLEGD